MQHLALAQRGLALWQLAAGSARQPAHKHSSSNSNVAELGLRIVPADNTSSWHASSRNMWYVSRKTPSCFWPLCMGNRCLAAYQRRMTTLLAGPSAPFALWSTLRMHCACTCTCMHIRHMRGSSLDRHQRTDVAVGCHALTYRVLSRVSPSPLLPVMLSLKASWESNSEGSCSPYASTRSGTCTWWVSSSNVDLTVEAFETLACA